MYDVTGTWAGYELYRATDLSDMSAVATAIERMKKRYQERDYVLPRCVRGVNIVPEILCITAVHKQETSDRKIVQRCDIKK